MSTVGQTSAGSVEIQKQSDSESVFQPQTATNATKFYSSDAPDGHRIAGTGESFTELFERFWGYQTGLYNGWWTNKKRVNRLRNNHILDVFMGRLELTEYQKQEAKRLMKSVVTDFRRYKVCNSNVIELALIALCAYVAEKDGRDCHPNNPDDDELFADLKSSFDIEPDNFTKVYGRLEYDIRTA